MTKMDKMISDETIIHQIFEVRGQKVMLDSSLASLYQVETKVLNQAVARNPDRFPADFMFELTEEEWYNLKSQIVTSSWGGRRKLPKVFTEHGVLMLSSVLNSSRAIKVNIQIVRIFSKVRQILFDSNEIQIQIHEIRNRLDNQDRNIELVFQYLDEFISSKNDQAPRRRIGYKSDEI